MDEFIAKFLQELGANLFFVKNFFFFFEHQIIMIFQGKNGENPILIMTIFAFWNKALAYLLSLYGRKGLDQQSFEAFFLYVSGNQDRLIPPERREYYDKLKERYRTYMLSRGNALDTIQKTGHYYHKTSSFSQNNAVLIKEAVFDTVVFTNEMYVNICNLFEVNETLPQYVS